MTKGENMAAVAIEVGEQAKWDAYLAKVPRGQKPVDVPGLRDGEAKKSLAAIELKRFAMHLINEYRRLGYPAMSAFAKMASRGTHAIGAVPDDPIMESVGRFFWRQNDVRRRIVVDHYAGGSEHLRAKRASMSIRRLRVEMDRIHRDLAAELWP